MRCAPENGCEKYFLKNEGCFGGFSLDSPVRRNISGPSRAGYEALE